MDVDLRKLGQPCERWKWAVWIINRGTIENLVLVILSTPFVGLQYLLVYDFRASYPFTYMEMYFRMEAPLASWTMKGSNLYFFGSRETRRNRNVILNTCRFQKIVNSIFLIDILSTDILLMNHDYFSKKYRWMLSQDPPFLYETYYYKST